MDVSVIFITVYKKVYKKDCYVRFGFFVIKSLSSNYIKVEGCCDFSSDHTPIILTISETPIQKEAPPRWTNCKIDWERSRVDLENRICSTSTTKD